MSGHRIDRKEGRRLFGLDPVAYDSARPGHAARVYEILVERCGLAAGTRLLEVGPGTGEATRRLLDLGARVLALEPDPALAAYLEDTLEARIEVKVTALEDAELEAAASTWPSPPRSSTASTRRSGSGSCTRRCRPERGSPSGGHCSGSPASRTRSYGRRARCSRT